MSKATDIIKRKNVNMEILKNKCKTVENYNTAIAICCGLKLIDYKSMLLTQKEFDLLKKEQEKQTNSKELEALETLKHLIYTGNTQEHSVALYKNDIDKCFDTIEKELKVLKLIIEKKVDVRGIYLNSLEFYNEIIMRVEEYYLKQDEFDFIKERVMRGERENE